MKLVVASDIHGCASATRKLFVQFAKLGGDRLILLGDLLHCGYTDGFHGGEVWGEEETVRLLRRHAAVTYAVHGNCDAEEDAEALGFPLVRGVGLVLDGGHGFVLAHGHHFSPSNPPPLATGDAFLSGHTHIARAVKRGGHWFVNPGSVSLPRGDLPASFILLEDGARATWFTLGGQEIMKRDLV